MTQTLDNRHRSGDFWACPPRGGSENQGPKKGNASVPHVMAGKGTEARNRGPMLHGSYERASLSARRDTILSSERAVLGGLIIGVIGLRDVCGVGEWITSELHAEIFCVLVAILESVPRVRRGIDLVAACRACEACGVWPLREQRVRGRLVGYVPDLARTNPRRQDALLAIEVLRRRAMRAYDIERDKDVLGRELLELLEQKATAFVAGVRYYGTIPMRRGGEREIEPEAIPPCNDRARLLRWIELLASSEAIRAERLDVIDYDDRSVADDVASAPIQRKQELVA